MENKTCSKRVLTSNQNPGSLDLRLFNNALTTKVLKKFVAENHIDINAIDINGNTLVHFAAKSDDADILKILLDRGANINFKAKTTGRSPLHIAVEWGKKRNVTILLSHGADANAKDKMGKTALHLVANKDIHLYGKKLIECFDKITRLLLQSGACVNEYDVLGQTPLFVAVQGKKKHLIEIFLKHGARVNVSDRNHMSPLHFAISTEDKDLVKLMLDNTADILMEDKVGNRSLHLAASRNSPEIVQILLDHGAPINDQNSDGLTALHVAVDAGREGCVQVLLNNQANLKIKDSNDRMPFHILARKYLHGCTRDEVQKFKRIARLLISGGFDINDVKDCEASVLHCAVMAKNMPILRLLLENKVDVNVLSFGESCLHCAARARNAKIVKMLLKHNADVNSQNVGGATALHVAISVEDEDVIQTLLNYNADLSVLNQDNLSPLETAVQNSNLSKLIIRHLALLNVDQISKKNRELFENDEKSNKEYNECLDEIMRMKSENVCSDVSYYDILRNYGEADLEKCVRNQNFVKLFQSGCYKLKFPVYCDLLNEKFYLGIQRMHLSKSVEKYLDFVWKHFNFPELIVRNIIYNLSMEDLQFVNTVFERSMVQEL